MTDNAIIFTEESLKKHNADLLDKVANVVKNRIDSYNPSYADVYNVITELSDVVLNSIVEMKANI